MTAAPHQPSTALPDEVVASEPAAERRLVSVLFVDLVGFTTLSESRDAEDVRELLSRYFDTSRQLIARYGGVVEKFIGDAVMAVWGTPVAREDDAERAVRAALDLVAAVTSLGEDVGAPDLRARAGVLTGEAAVTLGAEGEGMVAGDLVNTASRIQSVAPPEAVFVGEATRRSSEAAIAYESVGLHPLKGKAEPVPLWRASRVVAGKGGSMRATALEAPFVGRERELRLVKELFHGSEEERRAHLVSVVGIAGIGKSRLSWEFEKYSDGLLGDVWWHRGRCLAYGEGVAYWALAEMVRMRADITEGEDARAALEKLSASIAEFIADPDERSWVEPRLAHLLGLEDRTARDQADLFSAWRLFFERIAEHGVTTLVFEDLQWADSALLDFIDYLLEWSKDSPLFILTLSRPELSDRRPTWGAGRRNFTSLFLEPLSRRAMEELIRGLVPGLPAELRERILARADGVPLYAVETLRMLLDRNALKKVDDRFVVVSEVVDLDVPETLHALIAARLDGLSPSERSLLQVASVMGKTFNKAALCEVTGLSDGEVDDVLGSLVRKEVLQVQADPRSPERGQYGFLQDLVKRVAYETLSRRDRKAKHLAVAAYLESAFEDEDEIVEVLASHYLQAFHASSDGDDADLIKSKARTLLAAAARHASSLAASEEALRYFEQAADLADDPVEKASLLERAGLMAYQTANSQRAAELSEESIALYESSGRGHSAARVSARVAQIIWDKGRIEDAVARMERAYAVLADEEPDEAFATIAHQLGRLQFFSGHGEKALEAIEIALETAEALGLPEVISDGLNTKAVILESVGRTHEGMALLQYALRTALENDLGAASLRAYYNLADIADREDRYPDATGYVSEGLALARRLGNRTWEWNLLGQVHHLLLLGEWDELLAIAADLPSTAAGHSRGPVTTFLGSLPFVHVNRGEPEEARMALELLPDAEFSADVQERSYYFVGRAIVAHGLGDFEDALRDALQAYEVRNVTGIASDAAREAWVEAAEAALAARDDGRLSSLLSDVESLPRGRRPKLLESHAARIRGRLDATGSPERAAQSFAAAIAGFRQLGAVFWLAVTLLEAAESPVGSGGTPSRQGLEEARSIFENLRATPWLERLSRLG